MLIKRLFLFAFCFVLTFAGVWAGDVASFIDLGFSADGRSFMFGQYGVQARTLLPWAEIFVVDVARNNFVPNGRISFTDTTPIQAGQDGSGTLFQLVSRNSAIANRHGINHRNQGLPLFISRNENPSPWGETIDFRDFPSGDSYRAEIVPTILGSGRNTRSSFIIRLERRMANGQVRNYTVGTPQMVRPLIASYNIDRVFIDPSGSSIIFVIKMRRISDTGFDIRYMIEAQRL